jgi:hypothetical protein
VTTIDQYGRILRDAFAALHGGRPGEPSGAEAGRAEGLEHLQGQLAAVRSPKRLQKVHDALTRLLAAAIEADRELAQQVGAYARGETEASLRHSERVASLVAEGARLDRDLILALREAEGARPGTLAALGLADIVSPT